jgi:hypothetical protein
MELLTPRDAEKLSGIPAYQWRRYVNRRPGFGVMKHQGPKRYLIYIPRPHVERIMAGERPLDIVPRPMDWDIVPRVRG